MKTRAEQSDKLTNIRMNTEILWNTHLTARIHSLTHFISDVLSSSTFNLNFSKSNLDQAMMVFVCSAVVPPPLFSSRAIYFSILIAFFAAHMNKKIWIFVVRCAWKLWNRIEYSKPKYIDALCVYFIGVSFFLCMHGDWWMMHNNMKKCVLGEHVLVLRSNATFHFLYKTIYT